MKTAEIRQLFLTYFRDNGHEIVASSPLVPGNDPTLLFTNAGMVQFKDVFLGDDKRTYNRAVTSQRCVRAGGKHNDLENVGYTARHHTFFEMLGNFSFGDYFKNDAIHFAWDLLTNHIKLSPEKLWVTVFEEDDEAYDIWSKQIGIPLERISRIGSKDNFWSMGDTGPCGPCTEIFYDHGPGIWGGPPGTPEEDGDRYIEIWNLVFMQFNRLADGSMEPLPKPSVDTGMGLERLAAILQGVHGNYEIDLFQTLIAAASKATGCNNLEEKSLRVIADHIRSTAFMIVDGVTPSNEGRGYVLRRIIRRAIRHGYQLGKTEPFFHELVPVLVAEMGEAYPELAAAENTVTRALRQEGERFAETLDQGIKILDTEIGQLAGTEIPGDVVFKLYDTFGFPTDLTNDIARERELTLDMEGFDQAMTAQKQRARSASNFSAQETIKLNIDKPTEFTGYEGCYGEGKVLALIKDGTEIDALAAGEEAVVVLDHTPFYAESGGQVGDKGKLSGSGAFDVNDTQKLPGGLIGHFGRLRLGEIKKGARLKAEVISDQRSDTASNHSATHLLHAALKQVLGKHVRQKGSLVDADRLRFDFSHFEPISRDNLIQVEKLVNDQIRANHNVTDEEMAIDKARSAGAEALFGEKYGERVRTIKMGDFSFELCGGTHVSRTGNIGLLKITSEGGIAAGVRRIEAVTGSSAMKFINQQLEHIHHASQSLKCNNDELVGKVSQMVLRNRKLERDNQELNARLATASEVDINDLTQDVGGIKLLVKRQDNTEVKGLRLMLDKFKDQIGSGVVLLGSANKDKATMIAAVTKDLTQMVSAGKLIQELAPVVGGKGGGKSDIAQGGGNNIVELDNALAKAAEAIRSQLTI